MGGPAAWLGVGDRPLFPCCWCLRVGRVSDARSSLICAGWLPQDGLFEWNGHHCLRKRTWPARGWLFIGLAWIPFLARVPDSTCRQGHLLMILFVGRLLQIVGGVVRRGGAGRSLTCPMDVPVGGRGGCGVKGGRRPSRQRSRQRPLRPEGRPATLRGAPQRRCCRSWRVHGLGLASRP